MFIYVYIHLYVYAWIYMYVHKYIHIYLCIYQPTTSIYPEYRKSQGYPIKIRNKTELLTIPTPSNTVLEVLSPWAIKEENEIKRVQTGWVKKSNYPPFTYRCDAVHWRSQKYHHKTFKNDQECQQSGKIQNQHRKFSSISIH